MFHSHYQTVQSATWWDRKGHTNIRHALYYEHQRDKNITCVSSVALSDCLPVLVSAHCAPVYTCEVCLPSSFYGVLLLAAALLYVALALGLTCAGREPNEGHKTSQIKSTCIPFGFNKPFIDPFLFPSLPFPQLFLVLSSFRPCLEWKTYGRICNAQCKRTFALQSKIFFPSQLKWQFESQYMLVFSSFSLRQCLDLIMSFPRVFTFPPFYYQIMASVNKQTKNNAISTLLQLI